MATTQASHISRKKSGVSFKNEIHLSHMALGSSANRILLSVKLDNLRILDESLAPDLD